VPDDDDVPIVSESPGAADIDIYETAYRDEIERIRCRARKEDNEPTVYLTRRVDARLLALSGRAGRLIARGEEGFERINEAINFRERKAKVTEVSRALKAAAKEEYLRKKQEYEAARVESLAAKEGRATSPQGDSRPDTDTDNTAEAPAGGSTDKTARPGGSFRNAFGGRGSETGKQAMTSLLGLMNVVKEKARGSRAEFADT
jgi:hypothetical protein